MSVAVGTNRAIDGKNGVARIVIRKLTAWDAAAQTAVALDAGAFLESCQIQRNAAPASDPPDVYVMEFRWGGRRLRSPLVSFQARTQPVSVEAPARS